MLPVNKVPADGVAPTHASPLVAERVELIEQVVFTLVVDGAVGIVHPVLGRGEVVLRTVSLVVERAGLRALRKKPCTEQEQNDCGKTRDPDARSIHARLPSIHGVTHYDLTSQVNKHRGSGSVSG